MEKYTIKVRIEIRPDTTGGFPWMTPEGSGDASRALEKALAKFLATGESPEGHVTTASHGLTTVHLINSVTNRDSEGPDTYIDEYEFIAGFEQSDPETN